VGWVSAPAIVLPEVREAELKEWPFIEDPTSRMSDKLVRVDECGKSWLVLYEFNKDSSRYADGNAHEHGFRQEEFRFFYCVFVKKGRTAQFASYLDSEKSLNVNDFQPRDFTDGPYLGEAIWRDTWQREKFEGQIWKAPAGCEFAIPVANYHWEGNLDKTLPDGFSVCLPQKWFADELGLAMSSKGPECWVNHGGDIVIQTHLSLEHRVVVIDEAMLSEYSEEQDVEPIWLMIAERSVWPGGGNKELCCRRSEGAIWVDDRGWKQIGWNQDRIS
jgi:hypothetical protein